ncbi:hypothetical protein GCM10010112_49380 [Actinoplanes lobatus]|nr:hypothetical protein [Actinoplanes lobatus]GGN76869.1 hypothetical protein GCM10010112_49380 [Actinoplanes lobatus]GIE40847.1 hypothetical protein Alo02nite_37450 [Actinoplanes lobatus]
MITTWWALAARRRRTVMTLTALCLTAAVATGTFWPTEPLGLLLGLFAATFGLFLALAIAVRIVQRHEPTGLQADGAVFRSPRPSYLLALALPHFFAIGGIALAGSWTARHEHSLDPGWLLAVVLFTAPLALYLPGAWRGIGVDMSRQGIRSQQYLGTLHVPWEALAASQPDQPAEARGEIRLAYTDPSLVRHTGVAVRRDRLYVEGEDRDLIADAVAYYAADPAARAAIGSTEEYENLRLMSRTVSAHRRHAPEKIPSVIKIIGWYAGAGGALLITVWPPPGFTDHQVSTGFTAACLLLAACADWHTRAVAKRQRQPAHSQHSGR